MPTDLPADGKLADFDKDGSVVTERIANADHALEICRSFVNEDRERASRRNKVQGMFDGNAPKSQADMARANRAGDSNLNFKRHRGQIMNAWAPFFDMVCEVPVCIDGNLEYSDPTTDAELMRGFSEYFHDLLFNQTPEFDEANQLSDLQMLLHGPGILAWDDEWNYQPSAILTGRMYVPSETKISLSNCEMIMISGTMTAGELWRRIEGPTDPGWNKEYVKKVIVDHATSDSGMRDWQWDRWEQMFKNGDLYVSQRKTKLIHIYTLFVQEMDGTISQKVLPQQQGSARNVEYLYERKSIYEEWRNALCIFPYDIGADGTYHSVKGLGTDIYPFCALMNAIDNSAADLVLTGIKPMWQPSTNARMEEFKMAKWGGGNFIPNGINPLQMDVSRGIQPALELSRQFSNTMAGNTAAANANNDFAAPTVEETAKSAMIRAAERDKSARGLRNRYMRSKSCQYAETWRRAVNPKLKKWHPGGKRALAFQEKCYALCDKLGVDRKALQAVTDIKATLSLGLGSPAMRFEIVNQFTDPNFMDRLDEVGKTNVMRMKAAALTGYHSVDAIVPSATVGRDMTNDASVAAQEDNGFNTLGPEAEALVVPGQNHVLHLQIHVPSMEKDMQSCQDGQQPMDQCFNRLSGKIPHAEEHLATLAGNPTRKREYKEFKFAIDQIKSFAQELQMELEQQQANQPPPPEAPNPDMVKVQGNLEIKAQKEQATMQLRAQKQAFDQQLKAQNAEFERRLKDLETAANLNRKTVEHRVDTGLAVAKQTADTEMEHEDETETE